MGYVLVAPLVFFVAHSVSICLDLIMILHLLVLINICACFAPFEGQSSQGQTLMRNGQHELQ